MREPLSFRETVLAVALGVIVAYIIGAVLSLIFFVMLGLTLTL